MSQFLKILLRVTSMILAIYPSLWIVGVFAFTCRARLYLGKWPQPYQPDPAELPFEISYSILLNSISFLLPSLLLLLLIHPLARRFDLPLPAHLKRIQGFGWTGIFLFYFLPGVNFLEWFMDQK
jgi:hypothetical protein